jgi:hypothetical protein
MLIATSLNIGHRLHPTLSHLSCFQNSALPLPTHHTKNYFTLGGALPEQPCGILSLYHLVRFASILPSNPYPTQKNITGSRASRANPNPNPSSILPTFRASSNLTGVSSLHETFIMCSFQVIYAPLVFILLPNVRNVIPYGRSGFISYFITPLTHFYRSDPDKSTTFRLYQANPFSDSFILR